jgi:hypothetical protein
MESRFLSVLQIGAKLTSQVLDHKMADRHTVALRLGMLRQ